jgi:DNA ligase-associated metallophosphoesterase
VLKLNGAALTPDVSGALFWSEQHTLIVADLHLEKASSYAAGGQLLPPYDTPETLANLASVMRRLVARRVICLGDSFHDSDAPARLPPSQCAFLANLTRGTEWIWIAGNHDPAPPADLGGRVMSELCAGPLTFRHIARPRAAPGEISGHFHPMARVRSYGRNVMRPCFVADAARVILPAFGAFTGGLDVCDPAFPPLFAEDFEVVMVGRGKLHRFPAAKLEGYPLPR